MNDMTLWAKNPNRIHAINFSWPQCIAPWTTQPTNNKDFSEKSIDI